jgi:ubiquitin carboxyl-terminal hydrolase 5/13
VLLVSKCQSAHSCWVHSMDDTILQTVRHELPNVKVPSSYSRVYKDECVYSFATPESQEGIYVNLNTWQGVGSKFLALDHERSGNVLYFNERHRRGPKQDHEMDSRESVPTKMMIGGAEGFQVDSKNCTIEKETALVVMPERRVITLPCPELPELVLSAVAGIEVRKPCCASAVCCRRAFPCSSQHRSTRRAMP